MPGPLDELRGITRDVPHLEAEIRRCRFALRRIADELERAPSWAGLGLAVRTARQVAVQTLARR